MIRLFKKTEYYFFSHGCTPLHFMAIPVNGRDGHMLFLLLLSWGMYEAGKRAATGKIGPASQIKQEEWQWHNTGECLEKGGETLCTQLVELTRQFQILQTTNDDLVKQTKQLSKENSLLKGELDFSSMS